MTVDKKKSFQQAQTKASSANKAASFKAAGKGVVAAELEKRGINLAMFSAQNDKQAA